MSDRLEALGIRLRHLGLPITQPDSRLLVRPGATTAAVHTAEYERALTSCVVIRDIVLTEASGTTAPVTRVMPGYLEWAGGAASLVFAGPRDLSLSVDPGRWQIALGVDRPSLTPSGGYCAPELPSAPYLSWRIEAEQYTQTPAARGGSHHVLVDLEVPRGGRIVLAVGPQPAPPCSAASHDQLIEQANTTWSEWFDRLPPLSEHLRGIGDLAWWTLAANTLRLHSEPSTPVVVPSKLGYVGHWNWDAYFIAVGLRHGAPDLARAQLDLVLRHQRANGMFVDVIHDGGVLADTGDLPDADQLRLASHFGTAADAGAVRESLVPLTKPPLLAWAANTLLRVHTDDDLRVRAVDAALLNQQWWLTGNDTDGDGLAEYLHPYSSGLDDNPVFDHGAPTATPDLNAYLSLAYDELADLCGSDPDRAIELRRRAETHARRLVDRQWDGSAGRFVPIVRGTRLGAHTITDLVPLITGRLPTPVADQVVADLVDRATFGANPTVPTVSRADPAYQPSRMWRGPVWLNTNYLLIEALERTGRGSLARELRDRTLQLVTDSGEFAEYWDAEDGQRPSRAVTMFSWSAALFLDLAVRQGADGGEIG